MTKYAHTMNATFNIRRQGLTIYRELLEKYPVILGTIGIILLTYIFIWVLSLLLGDNIIYAPARATSITSILTFICCLIPFILYKNENRRMEGTFYAVSPSSTLEKTVSMLVISSVIFPLLCTVLLLSLDSLLTLMPFEHGYRGELWSTLFSTRRYIDSAMKVLGAMNTPAESMDIVNQCYDMIKALSVPPVVGMALNQSFFIFLNMLFRRHKIGYTLLTFLCLGIISIAAAIILSITFYAKLNNSTDIDLEAFIRSFSTGYTLLVIILTYALPILFWVLTYIRIRRIQY